MFLTFPKGNFSDCGRCESFGLDAIYSPLERDQITVAKGTKLAAVPITE